MSEVELSVIIPAYNAEKFIHRSVQSVLKQKIEQDKVEILVIENGSTDNTTEVVEKIIKKHENVQLFHSSKGVSNARNMGITQSQGKWVLFLDADDILIENVLLDILKDINKTNSDIYFYGHKNNNQDRVVCDNNQEEVFSCSNMEECKIRVLENPTRYMQAIAKLYKGEFLKENNLKFNPDLRLSEDSDFCFRCLQIAQRVEFKNNVIYKALPNPLSATRTVDGTKIKDYILALNQTKKSVSLETKKVQDAFWVYVLMHMNIAMVRENFSRNNKMSFGKKYKNMKNTINEPIFKKAIDITKKKECFSLRMSPILCLKLHFGLGAAIIYSIRALQNYLREK